jgi:hypothetical protein
MENTAPSRQAADIVAVAEVVLECTRRGAMERERPSFGLSRSQSALLAVIDGQRTLGDCARENSDINLTRMPRDAARLVAFGLAKVLRGELPQSLMVEAMNLTQRIPLDRLVPLEPERTAVKVEPRVAPTRPGRPPTLPDSEESVEVETPRRRAFNWPVLVVLLVLMVAAVSLHLMQRG